MQRQLSFLFFLALLCGFTSCNIQKRLYRNGFYVDRPDRVESTRLSSVEDVQLTENIATEESVLCSDAKDSVDAVQVQTSDSVSSAVKQTQHTDIVTDRVLEKRSVKNHSAALPLETDKKQAIGAGIACAIFFALGMVGLIVKGTSGPVGVFIAAAFVCFFLCMILAAFLYPREKKVEQPKESAPSGANKTVAIAGLVIGVILLSIFSVFAFAVLSLIGFF